MGEPVSNQRTAAIFWCLTAAALFGASTPASKALLPGIGPLALAGLLYLGAALAVLPFSFRGGSPRLMRMPRNLLMLLGAVVFGGGLGPVLLLLGLSLAPAASVSLWLNLETVATAILAWALFREHLDGKTWTAAILVVAAGVLLAAPSGFEFGWGAILVAAACLCWGLDNNLTALVDGFTPAQTTLAKGIVAGGANLILAFIIEGVHAGPGQWAPALGVGALSYGASIVLYIQGAQHLGATRSQILFSTSPFIGGDPRLDPSRRAGARRAGRRRRGDGRRALAASLGPTRPRARPRSDAPHPQPPARRRPSPPRPPRAAGVDPAHARALPRGTRPQPSPRPGPASPARALSIA